MHQKKIKFAINLMITIPIVKSSTAAAASTPATWVNLQSNVKKPRMFLLLKNQFNNMAAIQRCE